MPHRLATSSFSVPSDVGSASELSLGTAIHGSPRREVIATPPVVSFSSAVSSRARPVPSAVRSSAMNAVGSVGWRSAA